jgi:hypothetical protein
MDHLLGSSKGPRVASVDDRKRARPRRFDHGLGWGDLYPIKIDFKSVKIN